MKRSMKSKRVSWAAGVNLCQIVLFRKEESPSQVGHAKMQLLASTSCNQYPDNLQSYGPPPGFKGTVRGVPRIPSVKWSCPPKFSLNPTWHVAAGEESREVGAQSLRVSKVLESIYPHSSSIPSSPSVSEEAEVEPLRDSPIPIIPIIPIEEIESNILPPLHEPRPIYPPPLERASSSGLPAMVRPGSDVAAAALTISHNRIEQGSTIDMNLLIKIITNPELVQKLMNNPPEKNSLLAKSNLTVPSPIPDITGAKLDHTQAAIMPFNGLDREKSSVPVPVPRGLAPFRGTDQSHQTTVHGRGHSMEGVDYYKNLIRQHGLESQENMLGTYHSQSPLEPDNPNSQDRKLRGLETTDLKRKYRQKQCAFYNTPKGCRNGSNCLFRHASLPSQLQAGHVLDEPSAKRIKLGHEITGR
ncbi:hypothetical protein SAY86_019541 [Trapa natans]|uniref:C3H1-type domain-containing protein n=1 Tax=Trapa natans TaxID=22666 RepID=A0AAN7R3C8_TRANT|nr:hypothetical protein SAY86_019541 [Trapa natans]